MLPLFCKQTSKHCLQENVVVDIWCPNVDGIESWQVNVDVWLSQNQGLLKNGNPVAFHCSHKWHKKKIPIAVFCLSPFVICSPKSEFKVYNGLDIDMIRGVEKKYQFQLQFHEEIGRSLNESTQTSIVGGVNIIEMLRLTWLI